MRAMRGGDVSGGWSISLVIGLFFAGFFLAATLAISLGADFPQRYGFFTGLGLAVAVPAYRVWKAGYDKTKSIDLQAQAHDLELKAKQLEVELAKNSGAFDKWDKSQ